MRYDDKKSIECYKITEREAELAQLAYDHRNTFAGEAAMLELTKLVLGRFGDVNILYDLGADFSFDYKPIMKESFDRLWDKYNRECA